MEPAPPATVPFAVVPSLADRAIRTAEAQLARSPQAVEGYVALAVAYMRKAREVGDTESYLRAEAAVHRALALTTKLRGRAAYARLDPDGEA